MKPFFLSPGRSSQVIWVLSCDFSKITPNFKVKSIIARFAKNCEKLIFQLKNALESIPDVAATFSKVQNQGNHF